MYSKQQIIKLCIFLFPIIFVSSILVERIPTDPLSNNFISFFYEDGPAENIEFINYLVSFVFSIFIARSFFKNNYKLFCSLYIFLAVLFIFIAGEEISWGQRIFNFETPEQFSSNLQNEFNIHNFNSSLFTFLALAFSFIGVFGWLVLPKRTNKLYNLFKQNFLPKRFLITYFLMYPLLFFLYIFTPQKYTEVMIIQASTDIKLEILVWFNLFSLKDIEMAEFLFSLGVLFFILSVFFINVLTLQKRSNNLTES